MSWPSRLTTVFAGLLVMTIAAPARASQSAPAISAGATDVVAEGFRQIDASQYAAARKTFERALAVAIAAGDRNAEAEALRGLAAANYRLSDYAETKRRALEALPLFEAASNRRGIAQIHNQLGTIAIVAGRSEEARELYQRALSGFEAVNDVAGRVNVLRNLGLTFTAGDERSVRLHTEALLLARSIADRKLEGQLMHNLADTAYSRGDFAGSLEKLRQASSLLEGVGARPELTRVYISMGRLYRAHGRPEAAIPVYERALAIQLALGDALAAAQTYNALGMSLQILRRFSASIDAYRRGLTIARRIGASDLTDLLTANLAVVHLRLRQPQRALTLIEPIVRRPIPVTATFYTTVAWAYLDLNRPAEALAAADQAVAGNATAALEQIADAFHARAIANDRLGRIDAAIGDVERAAETVERLQARLVARDFMKRGFAETHQDLFALAVRLYQTAGRQRDAIEIAERGRTRALLDLLATRQLEQEPLTGFQPGVTGDPATKDIDSGLSSSASARAASLDELAATARRLGSTMVSYWVGEGQTAIWVVDRTGLVKSATVRVTRARIAELARLAGGGGPVAPGSVATWRELYDLLIQPVRAALPAGRGGLLTIVPHGGLFRIPFAALLGPDGRYLLEDFRLHYVPSGGVLAFTAAGTAPRTPASMTYALVANPSPAPRHGALPPLPGAVREIRAIAREAPSGAAVVLDGRTAGETQVRRAIVDRDVVHFAAHGVLSDRRPLESFLSLASPSGSTAELDGRLTTNEVYGLRLSAELVVLSACRSADGPISGDGVLSMTRAFLNAGAKSIIATVWDVPDESATQVMPAFYRAWRLALDKSTGLRAAQLDFLDRLRAGRAFIDTPGGRRALREDPFLWAGFVLIGEP